MRDYRGRAAVITGAGSGIGRGLALDLARRGARLDLTDISADAVAETAGLCRAAGATTYDAVLDVADRAAVFAHAADAATALGGIDLVVNNAGVALHGLVGELTEADMRWLMDINYWGMVHGSQAYLPHLARSRGQLANVSSLFGLVAAPKQAAYNASKFAIRGFTEALRQEQLLTGGHVAVSLIHPGGISTAIARSARMTASEDKAQAAATFDKVARTTPEKAARVILHGLERERPRILVGPDAWALAALPRLLGTRYERLYVALARRAGI